MSKVIIVTGASRGLGLAIAKHLLAGSANVVLAARSKDQLEALKAQYPGRVEYLVADLGNLETAPKLVELATKTFGRIDGLVINHGVLTPIARLADANVEEWKSHYDINLFGGVALVKSVIPELRKSTGSVVWVSSGAAKGAYTAWSAYGSGKAAVNHVVAHLAVEEPDITGIAIAPGKVDTDMQKLIREGGKEAMRAEDHAIFVGEHETGKLVKPEQSGAVIANFAARPDKGLSGKFVNWDGDELTAFREDA